MMRDRLHYAIRAVKGLAVEMPKYGEILPIGKGRILHEGRQIALVSLGTRLEQCQLAYQELAGCGLSISLVDARFAKPLDTDLLKMIALEHEAIITIEEGAVGGFGSHVAHYLSNAGFLDQGLKLRSLVMPDQYLGQANPRKCTLWRNWITGAIVKSVFSVLGKEMPEIGKIIA